MHIYRLACYKDMEARSKLWEEKTPLGWSGKIMHGGQVANDSMPAIIPQNTEASDFMPAIIPQNTDEVRGSMVGEPQH